MNGEIRLRIHANHGQLERVEKAIDDMAARRQWPEEMVFKVKLVVEEMGLNIIDHGYGSDESKELEFRLTAAADAVTMEFIDEARPFDPLTETPRPDTDAGIEERDIGGLGVYLVREMVDEVRYAREGNRNRLTLIIRL